MFSGNGEDQEDITVTIEQNWIIRFRVMDFEVLVNPYYGHLQFGNSARLCDVIEANSPLVMYIDFHKISFLQTVRGNIILNLSEMMQT